VPVLACVKKKKEDFSGVVGPEIDAVVAAAVCDRNDAEVVEVGSFDSADVADVAVDIVMVLNDESIEEEKGVLR